MGLLVFVGGVLVASAGFVLTLIAAGAPGRKRPVLTTNEDWRRGRTTQPCDKDRRRHSPRLAGMLLGQLVSAGGASLVYASLVILPS